MQGKQSHRSDPRILNHRTLQRDHRGLARILRPGMSVLDVGCGTGAITADIARIVGPNGQVIGLDRDESLLLPASQDHALPNLRFVQGDILNFQLDESFDIITAARVLQWISSPDVAISRMVQAAARGGKIVVLDYTMTITHGTPSLLANSCVFTKHFSNAGAPTVGIIEWRTACLAYSGRKICKPFSFTSKTRSPGAAIRISLSLLLFGFMSSKPSAHSLSPRAFLSSKHVSTPNLSTANG